jgi:glutamate formiminotransferase/formiminotetrahydrofolate cyclodeaminase
MPKTSDEEKAARTMIIEDAMLRAAQVPLSTCEQSLQVLHLACIAAEKGNINAITDAATAASLAVAALTAAGANVRINLKALSASDQAALLSEQLAGIENETRTYHQRIRDLLADRADIALL